MPRRGRTGGKWSGRDGQCEESGLEQEDDDLGGDLDRGARLGRLRVPIRAPGTRDASHYDHVCEGGGEWLDEKGRLVGNGRLAECPRWWARSAPRLSALALPQWNTTHGASL